MENENQEFAATSYHEIGHAVADYILYGKLHRFNHIHIGHYDAECELNEANKLKFETIYDLPRFDTIDNINFYLRETITSVAGYVAEEWLYRKRHPHDLSFDDMKSLPQYEGDCDLIRGLFGHNNLIVLSDMANIAIHFLLSNTDFPDYINKVIDYIIYVECEWNGDIDITSIDFYRAVGDEKNLKKERKRLKDLYNFNKLTH